jgi:hypothetical protein
LIGCSYGNKKTGVKAGLFACLAAVPNHNSTNIVPLFFIHDHLMPNYKDKEKVED